MSPKDPLQSAPQRELFNAMSKVATGCSADQVIEASAVLLINAIRQNCSMRHAAAGKFDEIAAKARQVLLNEHYDATGRRRNVFPFAQTISVSPVVNSNKLKGL